MLIMKEVELKAKIEDIESFRQVLLDHNTAHIYSGFMEDIIFDHPQLNLNRCGEKMRLRKYEQNNKTKLQWKGPITRRKGFKEREELSVEVDSFDSLKNMLEKLGFKEKSRVKRYIELYEIEGVTFRIEKYEQMDTLVEVEGDREAIDNILNKLPLQRADFTSKTFGEFIKAFEKRTGKKAILS